jgi:hypothetical protein
VSQHSPHAWDDAKIRDILAGNLSPNPQIRQEEIAFLFSYGTEESINQFYQNQRINLDSFNNNIVTAVGNTEFGNPPVALNTLYTGADEEKIRDKVIIQQDSIELLIKDWILETQVKDQSFEDFLANNARAQQEIQKIITKGALAGFDASGPIGKGGMRQTKPSPTDLSKMTAQEVLDNLTNIPEDPVDPKDVDDITNAEAKQCILLNLLEPLTELNHTEMAKKVYQGKRQGNPYSGRIVKINCDNPSTFINYLSSVNGSNDNLTNRIQQDHPYEKQTALSYRLSFIKYHDNEIIELPIVHAGGFEYSKNSSGELIKPNATLYGQIIPSTVGLEIDVTYEGNNPSTYRNDVDVKIRISSTTMTDFTKSWYYEGLVDDNGDRINFTLFDLILFPYLEKDSKGYGRAFKSQYSPSYNRLRLAYSNTMQSQTGRDPNMVNFFAKNVNVLDLAVVDHEFKRDEEGKKHELIINYKGYIQSVLSSPETDILSNKDIKDKRDNRDILLKEAIEKDCSLREIQKIQQELNELAQNDVEDVSSSLLTSIYARGITRVNNNIMGLGIYKLDYNSTIDKALRTPGGIVLDKIKKYIVDGKGDAVTINTAGAGRTSALGANDAADFQSDIQKGSSKIYFFYLADLLDAAILNSSIYKGLYLKDDDINKDVLVQKLRFIFGSFRGPDTLGTLYNIGDIPISVEFFLEWYHENVTKKELYIYPCLSFIRDITETVISNLLNNLCFGPLEESKTIIRNSFFTGAKINNKEPLFDVAETHYFREFGTGKSGPVDLDPIDQKKFPLIRPVFKANIKDYVNYCAIYSRDNRNNAANIARNVEITNFQYDNPSPRYGASTIAFSKTSQQGLRESRYARNGGSGITMLAGVYNASIKLTHPLNFIYPGQFFQISLFEPPDFKIKLPNGNSVGIFAELGLNGYYSVLKANHKINLANKTNEVTIDGIWVGSKSPYETRLAGSVKSVAQAKQSICEGFVDLSEEIGVRSLNPNFDLSAEIIKINGGPAAAGTAASSATLQQLRAAPPPPPTPLPPGTYGPTAPPPPNASPAPANQPTPLPAPAPTPQPPSGAPSNAALGIPEPVAGTNSSSPPGTDLDND